MNRTRNYQYGLLLQVFSTFMTQCRFLGTSQPEPFFGVGSRLIVWWKRQNWHKVFFPPHSTINLRFLVSGWTRFSSRQTTCFWWYLSRGSLAASWVAMPAHFSPWTASSGQRYAVELHLVVEFELGKCRGEDVLPKFASVPHSSHFGQLSLFCEIWMTR